MIWSRPLNEMTENPESNRRKKIETNLYDEANLIENNIRLKKSINYSTNHFRDSVRAQIPHKITDISDA